MFDKLNKVVSKVMTGSKTNLNTGLMGMLAMYLATKGFNLEEFQMWINNIFTSIESLIVLLTGTGIWFRQLKAVVKPKRKAKK